MAMLTTKPGTVRPDSRPLSTISSASIVKSANGLLWHVVDRAWLMVRMVPAVPVVGAILWVGRDPWLFEPQAVVFYPDSLGAALFRV